jgi:hypothetical protein
MSETTNTNASRNDEIDLLDLFRRMGKSLGKMFRVLGRVTLISIVFLLKNWLALGLSIVLGVGASYFLKITSDPFYQSELTLKPNSVNNTEISEKIKILQSYILEENIPAVSIALFLKPEAAENLLGIAACWYIDKGPDGIPDFVDYENRFDVKDTTQVRMKDRILIYVRTKAPLELPDLRDGILKYFNSDSLYQQRNKVRFIQNNEFRNRLDYDILQLDSLQKIIYFEETKSRQPQNGGQMIFLQEQKTQLIYEDVQTLYRRKQSIEADLILYNDIVTVIHDFTIPIKRMNGGFYYAKKIVPWIFILTLLVSITVANRKKIKEVFEKY